MVSSLKNEMKNLYAVIPAKAGIHGSDAWIPAFAGMTKHRENDKTPQG
jgi:hypothetical protein